VTTRLSQFLIEAPTLKPLVGRLKRIGELQRIYSETAPPALARSSRVGGLDGNTAIVIAYNGTVAAGLRQRLPGLLARMRAVEPEVTAIRVDVQLDSTSGSVIQKQSLTLSDAALKSISSLQESLPASPLKAALGRLARRGRDQDAS
jgi:hypothetical protein